MTSATAIMKIVASRCFKKIPRILDQSAWLFAGGTSGLSWESVAFERTSSAISIYSVLQRRTHDVTTNKENVPRNLMPTLSGSSISEASREESVTWKRGGLVP